jgi:hypothetical protein
MLRRHVGVETWFPLGWEGSAWEEDVRRAFAALGWTVTAIGPMPNTHYDWIELRSDGRELEPATLGNLLTELGLTAGEYTFDLQGFKHMAPTFVDADWWERCPDPRGLVAVAGDVARDRQPRKVPALIDERKGWRTILALRPFCRRPHPGDGGAALRCHEDLSAYLDAPDHRVGEARFSWIRKQAPLSLALQVVQFALEDLREARANEVTPPAEGAVERSKRQVAAVVRDIFDNPFRPVTCAPAWRTDTVLALARQMYEARDFSAMPILADALQDAGCDSAAVLDHCRSEEPHVRGCWVVDLVLGKE